VISRNAAIALCYTAAGSISRSRVAGIVTPPQELNFAVVIPAHNEASTIRLVVMRALRYADRVIVVDDGSSDGTSDVLKDMPVTLLLNERNQGKAASLWRGMQHALSLGVDAVVTLDADGQHDPADIPRIVAAARRSPGRIVIGARLADREKIPPLRYFANRFANFWIAWAAGYPIEDSQSGFRLYPAALLARVRVPHGPGKGFVFESEILIEASRLGYESVPVRVAAIYPLEGRPSHFRQFVDVERIVRMVTLKLLSRGLHPLGLVRSLKRRPPLQEEEGEERASAYKS
jgi:glycosyltransferase involved in cell wall biosynthesis